KPLLEGAVATQRTLPTEDQGDLAKSLSHVGDLLTLRAEYPGAESAYRQAISFQDSLPEDRRDKAVLAKSLFGIGKEQKERGNYPEAERSLRDALALQQQLFQGPNLDVALTLQALSSVVSERDPNEAISLVRSALAMHRALWPTQPHPDYA